MPPYEPLITTEEVAAPLRRSPGTVKNWRHQGRDPRYVTTEGEVRYWRRDVEAWIDAHRSLPERVARAAVSLPLSTVPPSSPSRRRRHVPRVWIEDRWHKKRPSAEKRECGKHRSKARRMVATKKHGKGSWWSVGYYDPSGDQREEVVPTEERRPGNGAQPGRPGGHGALA